MPLKIQSRKTKEEHHQILTRNKDNFMVKSQRTTEGERTIMGSIISSIKNGITSIRECNSAVREMTQNMAALTKCMNNAVSIVNDLQCISKEAKATVSVCTVKCQNNLHEKVYSKLTDEDKEIAFNVVFYEEFVTEMKTMKRVVEVSRNNKDFKFDVYEGLLENMKQIINEVKRSCVENEEKLKLLDALWNWIDKCVRKKHNSTQSDIQSDTNSSEESGINGSSHSSKLSSSSSSEYIEMKVIKSEGQPIAKPSQKFGKANRTALSKLRGSRKSNETFESNDIRRLFCTWHKIEENLGEKLKQHIRGTYLDMKLPVKASIMQRILTDAEPNYSDVFHYTPYMKRVRCLLKKPIRFEEIKVVDVKQKFKTDLDWKQCAEKVDETAVRMNFVRDDVVEQIVVIKQALLQEIASEDAFEQIVQSIEKQAWILDKETTFSIILDVVRQIGFGRMSEEKKNNYRKIIGLSLNEKQSTKDIYELAVSSIRNVERLNRRATKIEATNLTIIAQQFDKVITVLIEESRKPNFNLDMKLVNPACKEISQNILAKWLQAAVNPHKQCGLTDLKRTLSLPNFSAVHQAVTSNTVKTVVDILAKVVYEDLVSKEDGDPLRVLMGKLEDVKLPQNVEDFYTGFNQIFKN